MVSPLVAIGRHVVSVGDEAGAALIGAGSATLLVQAVTARRSGPPIVAEAAVVVRSSSLPVLVKRAQCPPLKRRWP
jgi:hypothetical protein